METVFVTRTICDSLIEQILAKQLVRVITRLSSQEREREVTVIVTPQCCGS